MKNINKYINESISDPTLEWHSIETLPDGTYKGYLWGHCFVQENDNTKYNFGVGIKSIYPMECIATIKNGKLENYELGKFQDPSFKKYYE